MVKYRAEDDDGNEIYLTAEIFESLSGDASVTFVDIDGVKFSVNLKKQCLNEAKITIDPNFIITINNRIIVRGEKEII